MSRDQIRDMLEHIDDTRELVLSSRAAEADDAWRVDELQLAWRAAASEARASYDAWSRLGGAEAFAVYVADEDRADAAAQALASQARGHAVRA